MKRFYLVLLLNSFLIAFPYVQASELKNFIDYCEEGSSRDSADGIKYTTQRLLWTVQTNDCKSAYEKLKALTSLDLHSDSEGGHQISDVRPLSGLTNLRHLDLSSNRIRDLQPLAALKRLSTLSLRGNRTSLDLRPLSSLVNLQSLDLCWLGNHGVAPLLKLEKLRSLGISGSSKLKSLSRLSLEKLEISNGHLNQGFLRPIAIMVSLKSLKIWVGSSRSQPADISSLYALRNLENLEFRDAWKLKNIEVVKNMSRLEVFGAPFSSISDLSPLAELKYLLSLNLRVNKVPADKNYCPISRGPEVLRQYCKKLIGRFDS
ncbi:MAG: leucine-rich repeat domain-containing protein [Oligoflexales bacterium]|nr:leucine-rich repeat domain-containing protein [Oligoflexales bacterium]